MNKKRLVEQIHEGRLVITPQFAARILKEANFVGQRPIYNHHVAFIANQMEKGQWNSGGQLAFCRFDDRLHLTNGQHRLSALVACCVEQEFQILITPCESMNDVEADYCRHDVIARKRSVPEILNSTSMAANSGLSKTMLRALYEAATLANNDLQYVSYVRDPINSRDVTLRMALAQEWMGEGLEYSSLIESAPTHIKTRLQNSGVMAVALITIKFQVSKAREFWGGLAKDDGLRRSDPRKVLLNDFETRNTARGTARQRVIPSICAWNAFFDGRELNSIKVYENSAINVRGTPIKPKPGERQP